MKHWHLFKKRYSRQGKTLMNCAGTTSGQSCFWASVGVSSKVKVMKNNNLTNIRFMPNMACTCGNLLCVRTMKVCCEMWNNQEKSKLNFVCSFLSFSKPDERHDDFLHGGTSVTDDLFSLPNKRGSSRCQQRKIIVGQTDGRPRYGVGKFRTDSIP